MENHSMMLFTKAGWEATSVHALLGKVKAELKRYGDAYLYESVR
jgi:hypothetical protein